MPSRIVAAILLTGLFSPASAADHPAGITSQVQLAGAKRGNW